MSHQNKSRGIFKRRVMVFLLKEIWLTFGVLHQEISENLWYKWSKKGIFFDHVTVCMLIWPWGVLTF